MKSGNYSSAKSDVVFRSHMDERIDMCHNIASILHYKGITVAAAARLLDTHNASISAAKFGHWHKVSLKELTNIHNKLKEKTTKHTDVPDIEPYSNTFPKGKNRQRGRKKTVHRVPLQPFDWYAKRQIEEQVFMGRKKTMALYDKMLYGRR